jgi:hypothetical protein
MVWLEWLHGGGTLHLLVEVSTSNLLQWIVWHQTNPFIPQLGHPTWGGILGQALMCMVLLLW